MRCGARSTEQERSAVKTYGLYQTILNVQLMISSIQNGETKHKNIKTLWILQCFFVEIMVKICYNTYVGCGNVLSAYSLYRYSAHLFGMISFHSYFCSTQS